MPRRRSFWGGRPHSRPVSPITSTPTTTRKKATCRGCNQSLAAGEAIVLVRLKKRFRVPCSGCGHTPAGQKKFHAGCVPSDLNKAMGYNPNAHTHVGTPTAAPPPKPPSATEASLVALDALEKALVLKLRDTPSAWTMKPDGKGGTKRALTDEWEKAFSTYQNLKARALRPGTPAEGEVATSIAIQRLVKMVYA